MSIRREYGRKNFHCCDVFWCLVFYRVLATGRTGGDMIGVDLDGTLLNYMGTDNKTEVNYTLLEVLRGKEIWIITNQGGIPFGLQWLRDSRGKSKKYPLPSDFMFRLHLAIESAKEYGVTVKGVSVCFYHPHADMDDVAQAHDATVALARGLSVPFYGFVGKAWRKPNPLMLKGLELDSFIGDSIEDEVAALHAADVPFVKIEQFTGNDED